MERVQVFNYCAHAIEDLKELSKATKFTAPRSSRAIQTVISMLRNSIKFLLPNCCELIDPEDFRQAHLDMARLPYPCVAFEAPWEKENVCLRMGEFAEALSTRRIALCWESDPANEVFPGSNDWLEYYPDGGVFVLPVYYSDDHRQWMVGAGGLFIPHSNFIRKATFEPKLPGSLIAKETRVQNGEAKASANEYLAEPFEVLPEMVEQLAYAFGSRDKATANIILNASDEVTMMIQACSVLNCANVTTVDMRAEPVINRKRIARGKQPFFSYKVLQLSAEPQTHAVATVAGEKGTHASPRMHLRRGHLRRLESKSIWVRHTMVNAGSKLGAVVKDYRINR
ncbi:hypothetical protein [Azohydromonas australica]|uniref:hypothetical protein n=1 Tax=Azohydromonas australica TaxID=364039 RepID=UPI0012EBD686|nr:hypothetical protein [Azohydromonas australica]